MARVLGVDIPDKKRGVISLTYIYGIGKNLAEKILDEAGVDQNKKVSEWTDDEQLKIRNAAYGKYKIEGELKSEIRLNIKRLQDIGSNRGIRLRIGLPVRGQKTKNNARTKKGKRKTVTNKKKVAK